MAGKRGPKTITAEHKAAITAGRAQVEAIRAYLDALATPKPRGKVRTAAEIRKELARVKADAEREPSPGRRLALVQRRLDLESELAAASAPRHDQMSELESTFVEHALAYSQRKGLTYAAWREVGVPAAVLVRAGIKRNGSE